MEHPSETYDRGFQSLFEDGFRLMVACEENPHEFDTQYSLARAAIACSMMLPEVCANICVETLQLEKSVFNDIDKLSPLAKFDFYLRVSFKNRRIDRGVKAVQALQELKRLRDRYVHPKKSKVEWKEAGDGAFHGTSPRTEILGICVNPKMWCLEDAVKAAQGVHEFLYYFFKTLCGYSKSRVSAMLFCEDPVIQLEQPSVPYYDEEFFSYIGRWQINVSYLNIGRL